MSLFRYIYGSLKYYRKANFLIMIGVVISTMVLTGTLIVGDSVRYSLERSTLLRLGKTEYLFSGIDRYFRASLAEDLRKSLKSDIAPIHQASGITTARGGEFRLNAVQVIGIDEQFLTIIPGEVQGKAPAGKDVWISQNVAARLRVKVGDAFVLRVEKVGQIPRNAPFVAADQIYHSIRVNVGRILGPDELGRFNIRTSQTAPYNVFIALSTLNEELELPDRANRILFGGSATVQGSDITEAIQEHWKTADMSLRIYEVDELGTLEIRSDRIFMDTTVVNAAMEIDPEAEEILTYMVNAFRSGSHETPYSFVSAGPFMGGPGRQDSEIIINNWLANDLEASVGDSVEIYFYTIGPLRKLVEEKTLLVVSNIVSIDGIYADRDLMPQIPGMSDAGNCRDWETGVPVNLGKIRDKDEEYWNQYRGTPKAFINYQLGKQLWQNRFGDCTAIRFYKEGLEAAEIESRLSQLIPPRKLGFSLRSVRREGLDAAHGGVDFSQLFMGLSFFLLVSCLILKTLLFNLHLERRGPEIGTLKAFGYTPGLIHKMMLLEGLFVAIPGVLLGVVLAVFYNQLIFAALNTVWYDIVRTSVLTEEVRIGTLLTGVGLSLALVVASMVYTIRRKLRSEISELQRNSSPAPFSRSRQKLFLYSSWITGFSAIALLAYEILSGKSLNTGAFFVAGVLLLLSFVLGVVFWLNRGDNSRPGKYTAGTLIRNNIYYGRTRGLRIILLFSLGTFIIISTGLNRKDPYSGAGQSESGTGGFLFFMETTLPILEDLNQADARVDLGINDTLAFVQFRKSEGDDASCLNLNRISSPRILGFQPDQLEGRFSFIESTEDLDKANPWSSLTRELEGNVIPAIADQTVIQWGLGMKVGDTLIYQDEYGHEMKLKLVGGLANSIFQGNILIDENLFLQHFPSSSGSHVLLVDAPFSKKEKLAEELEKTFRNEGLELEFTGDRLATFNQVENTYLSIFMILGGLAMILGTVGLGVVLLRNLYDRIREIGILQAIGFTKKSILRMIIWEHMILLGIGTLAGAACAFLAILPSLLTKFVSPSWGTALLITFLILVSGIISIYSITRKSLNKELYIALRVE